MANGFDSFTDGVSLEWSDIENKPQTFPADAPSWDSITGKPDTFPADAPTWEQVQNKPETFPIDKETAVVKWDNIEDIPDEVKNGSKGDITFSGSVKITDGNSSGRALIIGEGCTAYNDSVAIGYYSSARGLRGLAVGNSCAIDANCDSSVALGNSSKAQSSNSIAAGSYVTTNGVNSAAFGFQTESLAGQVVLGHYNERTGDGGANTGTDGTAFKIGNGTSKTELSNALRVQYDGTTYAKGEYSSTGADYAEYREWADNNPENEDRRGYFVTYDTAGKIVKATSKTAYIAGIISGRPCVVGNADECWDGQFLRDEFNEYIYEDSTDPETGQPVKTYKLNPAYDPSQVYIPRKERQEWDPVGMMGHLRVRDDGTCQPGGRCLPDDDGKATAADEGYYVVKRITPDVVEIVFSVYARF